MRWKLLLVALATILAGGPALAVTPPTVNLGPNWQQPAFTLNPGYGGATWSFDLGYNSTSGNYYPLAVDGSGQLIISNPGGGGGGGTGSNAAAGTNGATAPTASSSTGFTNNSGNQQAVTPGNGLPTAAGSGAYADGWNVTQGTEADAPWGGTGNATIVALLKAVYNASIAPLPSGTSVIGSILVPHQTPVGDTPVAVAANTSTTVWTTSAAARVVRVIPNTTTCFMRSDGGTASASYSPIPGGYVFNLIEPPPTQNITVFCTSATNVVVSQGN